MREHTKKLIFLATLSAIAYVLMFFFRFAIMPPPANFLDYDPKDVVIVIGGFLFGPLAALAVAFVVAFLEMITVSHTGPIGMVMNLLSSASFACAASLVYARWRKPAGAVCGLVCGILVATAVMVLWNWLIVPLYMPSITREAVVPMLATVFLPFNLLKHSINAGFAVVLHTAVRHIPALRGRLWDGKTGGR